MAVPTHMRGLVEHYVCEGWWHPNCKDGRVHDHPKEPKGNWSVAMHRLCEPVYTKRMVKLVDIGGGYRKIVEQERP